jgi:hypothetical protein
MVEKKIFELTSESKVNFLGIKLFRIKALVKGKYYEKGEIGGWVESLVLKSGDARVSGNAWVYGNAEVYGNARVSGNAWVSGNVEVYSNAWVYGNAWVSGNVEVYGNARVSGNAMVSGRFELTVSIDFDLPRININTKEKLQKLKKFLEEFDK